MNEMSEVSLVGLVMSWGFGYVGAMCGLGGMVLVPGVIVPELEPYCLAAFLVGVLVQPHNIEEERERKQDNKKTPMWMELTIAPGCALGYALVRPLLQRRIWYAAVVYLLLVPIGWRSGWKYLLYPVLLLGVAIGMHLYQMTLYGVFLTFYLCRLLYKVPKQPKRDAMFVRGCAAISAFIPGVNPSFLARLAYGQEYSFPEATSYEPAFEWGAAISFLVLNKADGKTLVGAYVQNAHPELLAVIVCTFIVCMIGCVLGSNLKVGINQPRPKHPPKLKNPKLRPPRKKKSVSVAKLIEERTSRWKPYIQLAASVIICACLSPISLLMPIVLTPILYALYRYQKVDLQPWLIPAFVAVA